jgi:hypothetical protein
MVEGALTLGRFSPRCFSLHLCNQLLLLQSHLYTGSSSEMYYVGQGWGLRCRWKLSRICDIERTFKIMIYSKLSLGFLPL